MLSISSLLHPREVTEERTFPNLRLVPILLQKSVEGYRAQWFRCCDAIRDGSMMGRLNHDLEQFFYSFRLDEAVPEDHLIREIAAVFDLSWVHCELASYCPNLDRPRDSGIFRSVFERVVGACIAAGLVGGEGFAVDASLIVADANKQRSTPGSQ